MLRASIWRVEASDHVAPACAIHAVKGEERAGAVQRDKSYGGSTEPQFATKPGAQMSSGVTANFGVYAQLTISYAVFCLKESSTPSRCPVRVPMVVIEQLSHAAACNLHPARGSSHAA